jgi:hypothetical protein
MQETINEYDPGTLSDAKDNRAGPFPNKRNMIRQLLTDSDLKNQMNSTGL